MAKSTILTELLDQLLAGQDPKKLLEQDGLLGELKKALAERMLNTEMEVISSKTVSRPPVTIVTAAVPRRC
jgi:hypothetical protein